MAEDGGDIKQLRYRVMLALYLPILLYSFSTFDLNEESVRARSAVSSLSGVPIDGWEDDERTYGPAYCYPATVEHADGEPFEDAHVITPERTHHGDDQLEVIAPAKLREELGLEDGSRLTIRVTEQR